MCEDGPVLGGEPGEGPVGGGVLGADRARVEGGPDPGEGEQDVAGVGVQLGDELGYGGDDRAPEIRGRDGVEELGGWGARTAGRSSAAPS